jgi:hypothetical protein
MILPTLLQKIIKEVSNILINGQCETGLSYSDRRISFTVTTAVNRSDIM